MILFSVYTLNLFYRYNFLKFFIYSSLQATMKKISLFAQINDKEILVTPGKFDFSFSLPLNHRDALYRKFKIENLSNNKEVLVFRGMHPVI